MKQYLFPFVFLPSVAAAQNTTQPNVLLIITDDQGFGDLSFNGNPFLKTQSIDRLAKESVRFSNFYVCPVSAPTRAGLMTGRYFLRTGVRDTYNGGAIMDPGEITLAELLGSKGYTTGHFGKWHLGDNYPSRPIDQGFDESVMHLSGGMGQVGDFTTWFRGDSSYFDPVLWHNGKMKEYKGYCTDIFASEAMRFIESNHNRPFFCYLAFNAPHTPLQVPGEYYNQFRELDPSLGLNDLPGRTPAMTPQNMEDARKVYAMVKNIDDNVGLILKKLEDLKIDNNTIVIFMTDNGPQQSRYNAGMRGLKSSVYRGGVRVPFYLRYPGLIKGNKNVDETCANIDVFPTIAELCSISLPEGRKIDGRSMVPLIKGDDTSLEERSLVFTWTRKYPELFNNVAIQRGSYKLVGHNDFDAATDDFELFNINEDTYEQNNLVITYPEKAAPLKEELKNVLMELVMSPAMTDQPRIIIGSDKENPLFLNRNDAAGDRGIWAQDEVYGFWRVRIMSGKYNISFKFINPLPEGGQMIMEAGSFIVQKKNTGNGLTTFRMNGVELSEMSCDLSPFYLTGGKRILPFWVEFERVE